MRLLLLLVVAGGCTSLTIRTGVVSYGGRPAFQASAEIGPAMIGKHTGVSASHEWGIESDERGSRAVGAMNVDLIQTDEDEGPIARIGVRARGTITDDVRRRTSAVLLRSAAYVGLGREKPGFGGLGIELAGGINFEPVTQSIFELNVVFGGKADH